MTTNNGTLFLIPIQLDEGEAPRQTTPAIVEVISKLEVFFVENIRTARRFLTQFETAKPIQQLEFHEVTKDTPAKECEKLVEEFLCIGRNVGVMSEAGCPGIADPGALIVAAAHKLACPVRPLAGGSSILMALMASGLQGQQFSFLGYLPIAKEERERAIKKIVHEITGENRSVILMETPYRNDEFLKYCVQFLPPNLWLSVSTEVTAPSEETHAMTIEQWRSLPALPSLHKRPSVFCIGPVQFARPLMSGN